METTAATVKKSPAMNEQTRSIEKAVTIDAAPDAVWKALTDAEEITRWFAPDARVTPGQGGKVWLSWGEGMGAPTGIGSKFPRSRKTPLEMRLLSFFLFAHHKGNFGGEPILNNPIVFHHGLHFLDPQGLNAVNGL